MVSIRDFGKNLNDYVKEADAILAFYNGKFVADESKLGGVCTIDQDSSSIRVDSGSVKVAVLNLFGETDSSEIQTNLNVTVAGRSELHLFELFAAHNQTSVLLQSGIKIQGEANSKINRLGAALLGDSAKTTASVSARIQKDATINFLQITNASKSHNDELIVHLDEEGASANVRSLSVGRGKNQCSLNSSIRHNVGHTKSYQQAEGVFAGSSRGEFSGHLYIDQDAQKSDAKQVSKNILLNSTAEVLSKPQLEVLADDVKAAHGATVSNVNENEIFYLTSRGIDRTTATKLLIDGRVRHLAEGFEKSSWLNRIAENLAERSVEGIL